MKKQRQINKLTRLISKRSTIIFLLCLICIAGYPLRAQNIKLNGYISDDAWWHYRHIETVVETGGRLNPDIYEFTTLSRPMTYPPLFHYLVAFGYKFFDKYISLIQYTNYINLLEALCYILLIYFISYVITNDKIWSLLGALAGSVSYGIVIRARAGELMPFVLADLLSLGAILVLFIILKDLNRKNAVFLSILSGVMFGLGMLAWSGSVFIYLPFILFMPVAVIIGEPRSTKVGFKLFLFCLLSSLIVFLPWYLPLITKYGISPHTKQLDWFMKNFTVLHQRKPFNFYIFTSGVSIFFIPAVALIYLFRRKPKNILFLLWIILAAVATYVGWRGYVAVVPIVSCICLSIGFSWLMHLFFREESKLPPILFIILFLTFGAIGYYITEVRISPLDPKNPGEVRSNEKSIKMLQFLRANFPDAIAVDHISWVSEDEAVGKIRMLNGQYLEYLPPGAGEVFKDMSRVYLSDEEEAFRICQKYNTELIIVRRQFLLLPQLSILFAPPELKSEDYLKVTKDSVMSREVTVNFSERGMQTIFYKMLSRQKLNRFELVYSDFDDSGPIAFAVVYKVKNPQ